MLSPFSCPVAHSFSCPVAHSFSCPVAHSFSLRPHLSLRPRFLLALLPHLKCRSLLLKEYFLRGLLLPRPPSTIILIHYSYYFPCCINLQSSFFPSFSTNSSISFPFPSFSKLRRPSRTVSPLVNHRRFSRGRVSSLECGPCH